MVKLSLEMKKRDVVWVSLIFVLISVGVVFAYGTSDPETFGHSAGEIEGGVGGSFSCLDIKGVSFTKIGNLGCMQNTEEDKNNDAKWLTDPDASKWDEANNYCYINFTGRLPSYSEWFAAVKFYSSVTIASGNWEWMLDVTGPNDEHALAGSGFDVYQTNVGGDTNELFRCFIPA